MKRLVFILGLLCWAGRLPAADDLAARVVILANSRQPESVRLAEFYAEKRAIPAANIIALPLPEAESITWREFIDQVYQPLQDELYRRGWLEGTSSTLLDRLGRRRYAPTGNRISYLVTCRGVPLRIYNDPTLIEEKVVRRVLTQFATNEGAVDSELSLLGQGAYENLGMLPNALYANDQALSLDAQLVVKVSRLDGPTWESARHLVTSALDAERTGVAGRYYVDIGGPDKEGDKWLAATQAQLQELGFDGDTESSRATFDPAARFDAPMFYFGWYTSSLNGPFLREGFAFPPGAIALHIYSFSAATLHADANAWCGAFIARGVTATVGNVFEPYLGFTHHPDLLLKALGAGKNFGDAVYYALPSLSWKAIALGDPLYQPFKVSLEEQLKVAPPSPYAVIRRANLSVRQGDKPGALASLKAAHRAQPSIALGLALAEMMALEGDAAGVASALGFAPMLKPIRPEDWSLLREAAGLLATNGARPMALQVYQNLARAKPPTPEALRAMLAEARTTADAAGDLKLSLELARQLNDLFPPLPPPPQK